MSIHQLSTEWHVYKTKYDVVDSASESGLLPQMRLWDRCIMSQIHVIEEKWKKKNGWRQTINLSGCRHVRSLCCWTLTSLTTTGLLGMWLRVTLDMGGLGDRVRHEDPWFVTPCHGRPWALSGRSRDLWRARPLTSTSLYPLWWRSKCAEQIKRTFLEPNVKQNKRAGYRTSVIH